MVTRWSVSGAVVIAAIGVSAAWGPVGQAAPHQLPQSQAPYIPAKFPKGATGEFTAVAAVPRSTDVWAVGDAGPPLYSPFFVVRRHGGHWKRVKTPKFGRFGGLDAVASASVKSVWVGGARQKGDHDFPGIWRWASGRFVAARLPKLKGGSQAASVNSLSASSATNVWAVGGLRLASGGRHVALHWDGKKWSAIAVREGLEVVSTSGPDNAWAVGDAGDLLHWNGMAWAVEDPGSELSGDFIDGIATSSPSLAYAVGYNSSGPGGQVLRFNGKSWSAAPLGTGMRQLTLYAVTIHGGSAWAYGIGVARQVIVHSSGGPWRIQQSLGRSVTVSGISAASATRAVAVGLHSVGARLVTFFDVDNGHAWKGVPSNVT